MSLDEMFFSEFRKTMTIRRGMYPIGLKDILLPEDLNSGTKPKKYLVLKGIEEEYFSSLNCTGNQCMTLFNKKLTRKIYDSEGKVRKDEVGKTRSEDVALPQGSVAIVTNRNIKLPFSVIPKQGYSYVDYMTRRVGEGDSTRVVKNFIYTVPKSVCYEVNMCDLVISMHKLTTREAYKCVQVVLTTGTVIYLQILKHRYTRDLDATGTAKVLCTKPTIDFNTEIEYLLKFWELNGVIFNRGYTKMTELVASGQKAYEDVAIYETVNDIPYDIYDKNRSLAGEIY